MISLEALKQHFHKALEFYPSTERQVFFQMLCEAYLQLQPHQLILNAKNQISEEKFKHFEMALIRLKNHEPIQYILERSHFFGLEFLVTPAVLIPRPETEELVAWILEHFKTTDAPTILDLGTGSGCISIALAKNLPNAKVFALDVSADALEIARFNAKKNNVEIHFIESNMLEWKSTQHFDIIVSNPPYVLETEQKQMKDNVLNFEPHLALFVECTSPLIYYKVLKTIAQHNLHANGLCFAEINEAFGTETKALFDEISFQNVILKKDTFGKNRMIKAQKK
ncbi:peptide chain release factor N(5)-glutamine methyltransferase [Flavobacteriaceae bacterium]|nr:peptide chain release factor N(5)-glutamine methyltransferase [Flavobacteriaceae bacterium]